MERDKFEKLVWEGITAIPERFLKKLNNVGIVIEDEPSEEKKRKLRLNKSTKIFGLYEGIPQTKRMYYSGVLPDKITIFKKTFEEVCNTEEEIKEKIKN